MSKESNKTTMDKAEKELNYWRHIAIKGVTEDAEKCNLILLLQDLWSLQMLLSKYLKEEIKNTRFLKRST